MTVAERASITTDPPQQQLERTNSLHLRARFEPPSFMHHSPPLTCVNEPATTKQRPMATENATTVKAHSFIAL